MNLKSFLRYKLKKKKEKYYISDSKGLSFLSNDLSSCSIFGIDTEFDWRTTYFPKVSLIQISVNDKLFLIDCLKINPTDFLKIHLENNEILKVFHSVRSDATVLSKSLSIKTKNVYDIQQADKLLTKSDIKAYGKIVNNFFGINLEKSETNSNWLKRPLSENQIKYAFDDVDFLLEIYNYQLKKLKKSNLLGKALSLSEREAILGNESLKKLRLIKLKNKFSKRNKKIFLWREEIAEKVDVPPAYIFKDKHLKKLSNIESHDLSARKKIMLIIGDTDLTEKFILNFL